MLVRLDEAEQRIWEMTDESDRNAARLAASLAELEKNKERLNETFEELEVTRNLLNAAQTRALEQERALSSERAKLARAGLDPGGSVATAPGSEGGVDRLFAELNPKRVGKVMDLAGGTSGKGHPPPTQESAGRVPSERRRPGVLLEPVATPSPGSAPEGETENGDQAEAPGKTVSGGGAREGS